MEENLNKSEIAKKEEEILKFWEENKIFEKTLEKDSPEGEFVFYEGPPTANGRPGIHHLEARAFKDIIPRYKTMRGFHVRRKGGWDTHGLPVELEVEKQLGISSKKQIEEYGIAEFNKKCKESVWKYVDEWERFTKRTGYWVDTKNPYVTYDPKYIESLWHIVGKINDRGLLYRDYKVVPWCPRCGTALSSHELAQGYKDVKDLSVYVKFRVKNPEKINLSGDVYFLAWTTTPWTLPGNVALAVGRSIEYVQVKMVQSQETYIIASDRISLLSEEYKVVKKNKGSDLISCEYEPIYDFLPKLVSSKKEDLEKAYKVYAADFVSTEEGTGIVHTAVMYGQDDFELGTKVGLPKYHLVDETGHFIKGTGFLEGRFVKDEETEVSIIKDLALRNILLKKEKYEHSYPFCWRCKTPLIYYARDSWYVKMTDLREELIKENQGINWEPKHIKEGRFGEWLSGIKDWAISRERYWGTPLPVWESKDRSERVVVDSIETLKKYSKKSGNKYLVMRHGEAVSNSKNIVSSKEDDSVKLTEKGVFDVEASAKRLSDEKIDFIISSPVFRAKETARIVAEKIGFESKKILIDERLKEIQVGDFEGKLVSEYHAYFSSYEEMFEKRPPGGENLSDLKKRLGDFIYELDSKYQNKTILIVSHEYPIWMLGAVAFCANKTETISLREGKDDFIKKAEYFQFPFFRLPHNEEYEIDLHRPFIDQIDLVSSSGAILKRTAEVMDVWFDSGAMPFAQDHYPFENKNWVENRGYPADYISEAIDQTRGWFYTLHAVGVLMGRGRAYRNVICLGHLLDKDGKKMSKSLGNVVNPWEMIEKYGADSLRFWMYSVNQPGDSKNFDEKTVQEVSNKVFNLFSNVSKFYELYAEESNFDQDPYKSPNILDKWILSVFDDFLKRVTKNLDSYNVLEASRSIRDFISDLSQWYLRRSRDRFKSEGGEDFKYALSTTRFVLFETARILAPFAPFKAEEVFLRLRKDGDPKSVHLLSWRESTRSKFFDFIFKYGKESAVIDLMSETRRVCSLALDGRQKAGIKVRQPLKTLKIKAKILYQKPEYISIIKDEVNVKEVIFEDNLASDVFLDTNITEDLKTEGFLREITRFIQDMRKRQNLVPKDKINIFIFSESGDLRKILETYQGELGKSLNSKSISFDNFDGGEVFESDGRVLRVSLSKDV